ncbi:helix-turn-helix domain-containing protein [Alkaliphilus crotonatoxidans]
MATIAQRIKEALEFRNMKQADLVEKTKIGKSSISTYISGEYEPKQRNIYKIAKALDVNEAWLMGHDVPMERRYVPGQDLGISSQSLDLLKNFDKLNDLGKIEATKRIEELTQIDKYTIKEETKPCFQPIVAHNDEELTEEELELMKQDIDEL